jgi:ATP-binding cassette, subfamily B, bacterial
MKITKFLCLFLIFNHVACIGQTEKTFPIIIQSDPNECGPVCLKMILEHYGKKIDLKELCSLSKMDSTGTSLLALSDAAEKVGMKTLAAKISIERLIEGLPLPAILHWDNNRFVVLTESKEDKFTIIDPVIGKIRYNKKKFCSHWFQSAITNGAEGVILLLETTDKF